MSFDPKITTEETEEPPGMIPSQDDNNSDAHNDKKGILMPLRKGFLYNSNQQILWIMSLFSKSKHDPTLRETIEEYIEEDIESTEETSISIHEKSLISNVLSLRNMSVSDIMIPRADIVAINKDISTGDLFDLLSTRQYSRLPVYIDTLDDVIGSIHVKDILATLARGEELVISDIIRNIPIISPSMQMLDLLLQMRESKKHMALVIDEFGGIDGLISIEDIVESIVGEIDDEHDPDDQAEIIIKTDGSIIADARVELDDFEEQFGKILTKEERNESHTLGGLIFFIAGRVPARGEVLTHKSGIKFEIIEADPRRIKSIYIRNAPIKK